MDRLECEDCVGVKHCNVEKMTNIDQENWENVEFLFYLNMI